MKLTRHLKTVAADVRRRKSPACFVRQSASLRRRLRHFGLLPRFLFLFAMIQLSSGAELRIGLIGLDTSHVIAFTKLLNDPKSPQHVPGGKGKQSSLLQFVVVPVLRQPGRVEEG